MKVIVPCAGRSSRYPDMPPKWMLPAWDGQPMIALAIQGLDVPRSDVVVTVLREHVEAFDAENGLRKALGGEFRIVVLDAPTRSQSETVAKTLEALGGDEPFLVKDSDNTFRLAPVEQPNNYISVASLNDFDNINPRNKSYCRMDHEHLVLNIREKKVISDTFSVGGYYFSRPSEFLATYHRLMAAEQYARSEIYLSDVIGAMILDGHVFKGRMVEGYQDWGTVHEWRRHLVGRNLLLVSLDGFVFQRGSLHFAPTFADVAVNPEAVAAIRARVAHGDRVVYVSIRPAALRALTEAQLADAGLPADTVIFDAPVAPWTLLTAPDATLPFTTSRAAEIDPRDPNLGEKVVPRW